MTLPIGPSAAVGGEQVMVTAATVAGAYDDHAQALFSYLMRRCHDRGLAEDLLSVAFLEAWRCRDRAFLLEGSLAPWLYGIANNVLRNSQRSMRRHRAALARLQSEAVDVHVADHADHVVATSGLDGLRAALDDAFGELSAKDRVVAELCLGHGLSINAAAAALGLPAGTVRSRLAHARVSLRGLLHTSGVCPDSDTAGCCGHVRGERAPRASDSATTTAWSAT